jgi:A/G-specific adenine glycosylase
MISQPEMNFSLDLLSWYALHKRDLPWRHTKDAYFIWLSEVIMQQTRIEQGLPYYEKFVETYPTVNELASADEQDVLKLWQGLGYYSRARNLHAAAKVVADDYAGIFPQSYDDIRKLKGIGEYTAAAIASICFDLPYAVVDGNVIRFISRLFGITESVDTAETKKKILSIATECLDPLNPGDYNQAMMEFGATVCTPVKPGCEDCIFKSACWAYLSHMVDEIPLRKSKVAVRERYIHYLVLTYTQEGEDFIYLNKRTGSDIWRNLYDFPCLELTAEKNTGILPLQSFTSLLNTSAAVLGNVTDEYIHLLTHQKLHVRFYRVHIPEKIELPFIPVKVSDLSAYPVPRLIDRYVLAQDWI